MANIQTVQEIYAAYGRGDVEAILARLAPTVEWEYGASPSNVPWLQPRRGRDGAAAFFAELAKNVEIRRFVPKEFFEGPQVVVVLLDVEFTVKATGQRIVEEDEIHVWRFDAAGQVVRYRHGVDSHGQQVAFGR